MGLQYVFIVAPLFCAVSFCINAFSVLVKDSVVSIHLVEQIHTKTVRAIWRTYDIQLSVTFLWISLKFPATTSPLNSSHIFPTPCRILSNVEGISFYSDLAAHFVASTGPPTWLSGKEYLPMQEMQKTWVWSLGWEDPWRRKWQPTPVFLPGKSHGQRSLAGYSPRGHKELDTTEWLNTQTHMLCS